MKKLITELIVQQTAKPPTVSQLSLLFFFHRILVGEEVLLTVTCVWRNYSIRKRETGTIRDGDVSNHNMKFSDEKGGWGWGSEKMNKTTILRDSIHRDL